MIHFPELHNEDNMNGRTQVEQDPNKPFQLYNVNAFKDSVKRAQTAHDYHQLNTILKRVNDELQKVAERNHSEISFPPSGHICIAAQGREKSEHFELAANECKKQGYLARVEEQNDNTYLVVYIPME